VSNGFDDARGDDRLALAVEEERELPRGADRGVAGQVVLE
jgi:hypothetical protein